MQMWKVCTCYVSQQLTEEHQKISGTGSVAEELYFCNVEYFLIPQNLKEKKNVFSEKTSKNWFGGTFDHFLQKGGILLQKLR